MPIPKVRTGRLAPDQEALDYYDTPVKHWTHTDWDQIDMSKVDVGLHSDPTPGGLQAADRRMYNQLMVGKGDDVTKDMRIHVGNSLHADDIGHWDIPGYAKDAILEALYDRDPKLAARFELAFPNTSIASSTIKGDPRAVEEMAAMRQFLLDNDIQTIAYTNAEEGLQGAVDAATTNPQWLSFEEEQLGKIQALRMDSARAERNGDMDLSEQINDEANMLEDELEYARDEAVREAEADNISYISLDPGNVRSADAAFSKENIGKAGMMLGVGGLGVGLAGGSSEAEAGIIKPSQLIDIPERILSPDYVPENTQTAYKMFRTDGNELYPLFVDANTPVNVGEWQKAIVGDQSASGKVKSKIGDLAYRPGWHAGSNAAALHIGGKVDPATGQRIKGSMPPNTREANQVWAEVEMADDLDWQSVANAQGGLTKSGKPKLRDMHITDGVPYGGSYRYKTNSNMEGDWLIGGDMRVNRVLSDEEVADINATQGYADLPRRERSDLLPGLLEKYGRNLASLAPVGTIGALSSLASNDTAAADLSAGVLDVANRAGEMLINDTLTGSQMLSNALYDTDDAAPQVQLAPRTEAGDTLSEGLMSDFMGLLEYRGLGGNMPSAMDAIEGGINAYNQYLKPYLSDRQEQALGGGALLASMVGLPGKKNVVTNTVDTRLGKQTPAANTRSMEEQATRVREALAEEGGYETIAEDVVDLQSLPVLSRSDLEGGVFMPTSGDRTMHARLKRSSGIDVDADLQGGPGYGALYDDWESTADIANSYQDKVRQVAEAAGTDKVFGSFNPMRLPSANFSTMPAEVASQQLQTLLGAGARYNPKLVDEINRAVAESGGKKKPNRDFPGILSPDAETFLSQRGSAPVKARKAMLGEMAKAPYRDAGFPLVGQIYRDVSYPELHNRDIGETGDLILRLDPNAPTRTSDWHRSYGTVVPSQGRAARLAGTAPFSTVYRDAWNQLSGAMTEPKLNKKGEWTTPRLLNKLEKTNTINWNKPRSEKARTSGFQLIDEQLLDELQRRGLLAD